MTETPNPVDTAAYLLPVNGPVISATGGIEPETANPATATSLTIAGPQTAAQGFTLSVRDALTTFPVPSFRPTTVNTGLALDIMPNGNPGNSPVAPLSVCWFDVCNADTLDGAHAVATARVGCGTALSEFGSYAFSGAALNPLALTMGGVIAMNLANNGYQWDFSKNFPVNGRSYMMLTNSSAGTGAYAEMGIQNNITSGVITIRAYGGGWTTVAADQNYGELTTGIGLSGLNLTTVTGPIRILTGGYTPGGPGVGQTAATFNSTAAANAPGSMVANYPIIPPSYLVSTLPTPTAALAGARAFVTDQLTALPLWGGALTGGGALICPCWCTGAAGAWVAG
jgi:hypothetical protein